MLKAEYSKPEIKVDEYTQVDILTASDNSDDLHSTDEYNYGGKP